MAHLFALIHSLPAVLPADAGLLVVDEISLAFMAAFPRTADGSMASGQGGGKRTNAQARWTLARKQTVMANLTHRLGRLAAMHNLAVVVVNQSMTRVRRDLGYAVLEPTIASPTWNEGIESQILLFRDAYKHASQPIRSIRLASVVTRTNDWQYEQGHWNGISPLVISEVSSYSLLCTGELTDTQSYP